MAAADVEIENDAENAGYAANSSTEIDVENAADVDIGNDAENVAAGNIEIDSENAKNAKIEIENGASLEVKTKSREKSMKIANGEHNPLLFVNKNCEFILIRFESYDITVRFRFCEHFD